MKDDSLYPYYLFYLYEKLIEGRLSEGKLALLKISGQTFEEFKFQYENDQHFHKKVLEIYKTEARDKRIDDILNIGE